MPEQHHNEHGQVKDADIARDMADIEDRGRDRAKTYPAGIDDRIIQDAKTESTVRGA